MNCQRWGCWVLVLLPIVLMFILIDRPKKKPPYYTGGWWTNISGMVEPYSKKGK